MSAQHVRGDDPHRGREIGQQFAFQLRCVGKVGGQKFVVEDVLSVGHQHRQFRPGQAALSGTALTDGLVVRQELDFAG